MNILNIVTVMENKTIATKIKEILNQVIDYQYKILSILFSLNYSLHCNQSQGMDGQCTTVELRGSYRFLSRIKGSGLVKFNFQKYIQTLFSNLYKQTTNVTHLLAHISLYFLGSTPLESEPGRLATP